MCRLNSKADFFLLQCIDLSTPIVGNRQFMAFLHSKNSTKICKIKEMAKKPLSSGGT